MSDGATRIEDVDVSREMRDSFLEYAYSVIYARALPDARDGMKPVQRRIIYQMAKMGLLPSRGHVKSQRVVGEVMGKLHPHGDAAIYDALVRLAQDFTLRLPLVDGHGNFGSLDDGPAAARYTEVRMAPPALDMVADLDEDVVDFVPNYDNQFMQPEVLPAAIPALLVNGASGIAVGMATNIAPHNLGEVIAGAIHLLDNPDATIAELMRFIPGPDLPGGGKIIGLDGVREAYETGRGSFRTQATYSIERISARKRGIVVTELPYQVGPERVIDRIKDAVSKGKIKGLAAVTNLTDRDHDLRLVIEVKSSFNPEAVLANLLKATPMEDSFGINAVALVNGQPTTLTLKDMLQVFLDHRMDIVKRRCEFRLQRANQRLHLVEGLLIAVLDIDDVIAIIRHSDDAAEAHARLREAFDLSELQADHILALRLRRLTKFSRIELENEQRSLQEEIAHLEYLLANEPARRDVVREELNDVSARHATPRRTILLEDDSTVISAATSAKAPLEIPDEPCTVVLSSQGRLARIATTGPISRSGPRVSADAIKASVQTTTRSQVHVVDSAGMAHQVNVVDLPGLPPTEDAPSLAGAIGASDLVATDLPIVGLVDTFSPVPIGLISASGTVKRVKTDDYPQNRDSFSLINLGEDELVWAGSAGDDGSFTCVSDQAKILRFPAASVRPQGRSAGGMAGMKTADSRLIAAAWVSETELESAYVTTIAAGADVLPGTIAGSAKVSPLAEYPEKGRATQGMRVQRFLRGEDQLQYAAITPDLPRAVNRSGAPVNLPPVSDRRDGSGAALTQAVDAIG